MNKGAIFILILTIFLLSCQSNESQQTSKTPARSNLKIDFNLEQAERLFALPFECIQQEFPYKSGLTIAKAEDLALPKEHHPAFYGCFDWHSAVHGHWSLIYLMKTFPDLKNREEAMRMIAANLSTENIAVEFGYFSMNKSSKTFERTYGWAWLLKLQEELYTWDHPQAKVWVQNLTPLVEYISKAYVEYLPKLVYPIRVGEHSNTAFGLSFAYDYAATVNDEELLTSIRSNALRFYKEDQGCPISWEPSGYDFLSPCLQEMDIMRKVLDAAEFESWVQSFLPSLSDYTMSLEPAIIKDRSDGKLVHLDGLNFSRAWCLYPLTDNIHAHNLGAEHLQFSLDNIVDDDYAGQHWLGSFALYAFKTKVAAENEN